MLFDHVAIVVSDIKNSVEWYSERFPGVSVEYQDDTWAIINCCGLKLAFVLKSQHPKHIAFCPDKDELMHDDFCNKKISIHRDGTRSFYINDPDGNTIEVLYR